MRWQEAVSQSLIHGDEDFRDVEVLFLRNGNHRALPEAAYEVEVARRLPAMENALRDLYCEASSKLDRNASPSSSMSSLQKRKTRMSFWRAPPVSIRRKA